MPELISLCENWNFKVGFEPELVGIFQPGEEVSVPHTALELPFDYFDERKFEKPFTYQRIIARSDAWQGKEVCLVFDGAMANAAVFVNGAFAGGHKDGYTPFEIRLTDFLKEGDCLVTISVDGSENPEIPPFGGRIDYLTYAGIYREVWLKVADKVSIRNVKIETQDVLGSTPAAEVTVWLANPQNIDLNGRLQGELLCPDGTIITSSETVFGQSENLHLRFDRLGEILLWDLENPSLYTLRLTLRTSDYVDRIEKSFGFRAAEFTPEGFFLNGRKLKLVGLNRHQSFPYSGYAQGRASQECDAELLKNELGCNIVRTSHYPQSPWFLDHCDRIGLLVLEEIPGWQYLGGDTWKDEAIENVRRMIERDWNHPSIVLWGVRINESPDDDTFYKRTNLLARDLDGTRPTGGIRKHTESSFLEDVYTFNDFVLGSSEDPRVNRPRTPLRSREETTGLAEPVPYLVTEYNGHMYPTKVFDQEQRQVEHVTRHLEILNATYGDENISGCIGWCMFDYNTHQDFGSGDRVCHHGVMTMFREKKFAAHAYASQMDPARKVVLEPVTYWARGERNIGGTLPLLILSNCDRIQMRFPNGDSLDIEPDRRSYPHLPHAPFIVDRDPEAEQIIGVWGQTWPDVEFVGFLDGKQIVSRKFAGDPVASTLQLQPDRTLLDAAHSETRVLVKALDQAGNKLPFLNDSISIELAGPISLIGPDIIPLRGGGTGFWLRAHDGADGEARISVKTGRFPQQSIEMKVSTTS